MPNPTPKKKTPIDLGSLARAYTEPMIKTLGGYACGNDEVEPDIRIRAIGMLLDRGWGKAAQPVTGAGGDGPLIVEIINRAREKK